jgi:hypothetical protein
MTPEQRSAFAAWMQDAGLGAAPASPLAQS